MKGFDVSWLKLIFRSFHLCCSVLGETLPEGSGRRTPLLFETWRPPRYYIPPEDVRPGLLVPSETKTVCPYKGVASYRSARSNGEVAEDLAWYYPEPLPEAKVKEYLCFYDEKVDSKFEG